MTKQTRYFMAGSAAVLAAGLGTGLIAYYMGGFQPLQAAPISTELRYVPADATVVAYADVRAIMDSELRLRLKQALPMHGEKGQQEFQEQTGIDIERDIDFIVASISTALGKPPLVVARGRFNDTRLEGLIRQHGGVVEEYKGKRLVVAKHDTPEGMPAHHGPNMVLAFLEPGLVAIGDMAIVKAAIDAQMSAHSITSNSEMMEVVADVARGNNAWAVGRFDVIASHANLPREVSQRIPPVKWFAAAGHINGGVTGMLRAEANDEESAEQLRKVVAGFQALAQLQAHSDPKAKMLVDSLQLTGSGKTVALSFTVPAEVLEMLPKQPAGQ